MKFTKEQQDYIKNACEHIEVLTGGRGHSKTKKVIEDMQQEIERLNNIIKNIENICESSIASVDNILQDEKETKIVNGRCINRNEYQIVRLKAYRTKSKEILGKIKELKGDDKE